MPDDDECWKIAMAKDRRFDGVFVTGVHSTGIYCRPSCPARAPKRENVRFYANCNDAEAAGLRACKRCAPDQQSRDESAVAEALAFIQSSQEAVSLEQIAALASYSPAHFQRVFKRAVGLSPAAYQRALRRERGSKALSENSSVTEAISHAGYSAPSRFYDNRKEQSAMTASAWNKGGAGVTIHWAVVETALGNMLVAATDKGVCRLSFAEGEEELRRRFPNARLEQGGEDFEKLLQRVVDAVQHPGTGQDIPLDVQGTAFQEAVWQALRAVPPGETRSYGEIAAAVGRPKAVRAVGSANGANNVAVLIPCHRIVRSDGSLGGYAYGLDVKKALLEEESK